MKLMLVTERAIVRAGVGSAGGLEQQKPTDERKDAGDRADHQQSQSRGVVERRMFCEMMKEMDEGQ